MRLFVLTILLLLTACQPSPPPQYFTTPLMPFVCVPMPPQHAEPIPASAVREI